ncbi:MAG TPA: DNA recombination protein RmuC [Anaeromyxobacteraceae bacterium]|nr:DNA recombination protein RmuC [Anaeromyxobacteraceae bacterium]
MGSEFPIVAFVSFALGLGLGALVAAALGRGRAAQARAEARQAALAEGARELRAEGERRAALEARLAEEKRASAEKAALLEEAKVRLSDAFKALSAEALQAQGRQFLDLARASLEKFQAGAQGDLSQRQKAIADLVAPVKETVAKLGDKLSDLEKTRAGAYAELREQVRSLGEAQGQLRLEASKLVQALRAPQVRGRWGEVQLRRVVELAGMQEHCDFEEQETLATGGGRLRPDLIVRLPGGRCLAVDAKAPLAAYLEAVDAVEEPVRRARLADHARQIRDHVAKLSQKAYHEHLGQTPEFVVLFLPGESFFAAALEQDPSLIETAAEAGVVLATPTTLIALLKAVAYGWRQESIAESARRVAELGRELHDRLAVLGRHVARVGKELGGAVSAYNDFVGSLESRVLPAARRLKEHGAGSASAEVPELEPVEELPRSPLPASLAAGS